MKKILTIFILLCLVSIPVYAATYIKYGGTLDSTGTTCFDLKGYPYRSYEIRETTDGATFDVEFSDVSTGRDLTSDENDLRTDQVSDAYGNITSTQRYMCIRISACSTCELTYVVSGMD
jgi:hypothetical protein